MDTSTIAQRMNLPWVESPFFDKLITQKPLTPKQREMVATYHKEGFIVLPNLISTDLIDQTIQEIKHEFPAHLGEEPMRHQDLWKKYSSVRQIASAPEIFDVLRLLYEREPIPFQTLNFKFGSQQRAHSDMIHFSSLPARFMCGVWVAMEDTNAENGPLFYYPHSHHNEEFNYFNIGIEAKKDLSEYTEYEDFMEAFMDSCNYERREIHLHKGDVMIWSSNLVHGGSPILKTDATRWSQVTHFYFEGCMYYSPRFSDMFAGNLKLRNVIDIKTGHTIQHSENGKPIETINTGEFRYAVSHHFTVGVLAKGLIKKIIGKKPF
ncbi:phytanoyl-CoA dioxygenase family protein [Spirosoma litoris]